MLMVWFLTKVSQVLSCLCMAPSSGALLIVIVEEPPLNKTLTGLSKELIATWVAVIVIPPVEVYVGLLNVDPDAAVHPIF